MSRLLTGQAVSSVGDGIWISTWIIFLTAIAGYPAATVGLVVSSAGIVGVGVAYPLGAAADRFGARNILVAVNVVRGLAMLAFCVIHTTISLLIVAVVFFGTQSGGAGVRNGLVCKLFAGDELMAVLARVRVVQHIGYAGGAGLGAGVLALDRPGVFLLSLVVNGVTFFVLAVLAATLPADPAEPAFTGRASGDVAALRDHPYNVVMLVTALPALCWALLTIGIPLWVRNATTAPTWLSGLIVFLSSFCIAAFQLGVTKTAAGIGRASRAAVVSGAALAACCLLLATARWPGAAVASLIVVLAGLVHITGELYFVAARWGLSLALMNPQQTGKYQGAAAASEAAVQAVGPAVVIGIVGAPGITGWLSLAAVFAVVGLVTPPLAQWAARRKGACPVEASSV
ncbi:MAG: MFS transporter [Pseudonocardiaceae bacterium]